MDRSDLEPLSYAKRLTTVVGPKPTGKSRLNGNRSGEMLKTWLSGDKRRASWEPGALVKGLGALSKTGADGAPARALYGNLIGDQYLAGNSADKLTPEQWNRVAQVCGSGMNADYQRQIKAKVRAAYVTPENIAKMDRKQAADVAAALKAVGDTAAGDVQAGWLLNAPEGKSLTGKELVGEIKAIARNGTSAELSNALIEKCQALLVN